MKTKMSDAHTVEWSKDPLTDRQKQVDAMKGFKGSKFERNPFKDAKVRQQIDPTYAPHRGGEQQ